MTANVRATRRVVRRPDTGLSRLDRRQLRRRFADLVRPGSGKCRDITVKSARRIGRSSDAPIADAGGGEGLGVEMVAAVDDQSFAQTRGQCIRIDLAELRPLGQYQ